MVLILILAFGIRLLLKMNHAVSDIQNIIRALKGRQIGVLITDHNVRETLGIVDRAYIMNQGELLVSGPPQEIVASEKAKKFYLGEQFKM